MQHNVHRSILKIIESFFPTYFLTFDKHILMLGGQSINVVVDNDIDSHGSTVIIENTAELKPNDPSSSRAAVGVAAAAGVVGLLLLGPVTGIVIAGAAIYATTREDKIGDIARNSGSKVADAYDFGMKKANEHNVFDRIKSAGNMTYNKAREIDKEMKITETAGIKARELNEKHQITERVSASAAEAGPQVMSALWKMGGSLSSKSKK